MIGHVTILWTHFSPALTFAIILVLMIDMLPPPAVEAPATSGIHILTPDEIASVAHLFTQSGNTVPDPANSVFLGETENGEVISFLVLQLKLHAEPMWIKEGHSDKFLPLARAAERYILQKVGPQWVYLFAPAGKVARLAETMGMQMEPYVVMSKLVQPDVPGKPATMLPEQPMVIENPFDDSAPVSEMIQ